MNKDNSEMYEMKKYTIKKIENVRTLYYEMSIIVSAFKYIWSEISRLTIPCEYKDICNPQQLQNIENKEILFYILSYHNIKNLLGLLNEGCDNHASDCSTSIKEIKKCNCESVIYKIDKNLFYYKRCLKQNSDELKEIIECTTLFINKLKRDEHSNYGELKTHKKKIDILKFHFKRLNIDLENKYRQ